MGTTGPAIWRNRIVGYEERDPRSLLANPKNWRVHPKFQAEVLQTVLTRVGWVQNIIVNVHPTEFGAPSDTILDGHERVTLALATAQPRVPCTLVDLTLAEEAEILATLDPIAALAATDSAKLGELLAELDRSDATLAAMYDDLARAAGSMAALLDASRPASSDDADAAKLFTPDKKDTARARWQVAVGDVWAVPSVREPGITHTVRCGDSRDPAQVAAALRGTAPHVLGDSPPYGVGMEYEEAEPQFAATCSLVAAILRASAPAVRPDGFAFVNFGDRYSFPKLMGQVYVEIFAGLPGWRWYDFRYWKRDSVGLAIWNTTQPRAMSDMESLFTWQHGTARYPVHDLSLSKESLWTAEGSSAGQGHPAVMAVGIAERAILIYTAPGDVVLDPCGGVLTTLVAAERAGRAAVCQEIDPTYVALGLTRCAERGMDPRRIASTAQEDVTSVTSDPVGSRARERAGI